MKRAAVINDLSGFGRCSLTAAIPVLSVLGVQCVPLATAVLTGQTGYEHYYCRELTDMMPQYLDAWKQNGASFDAVCSGFLTGPDQIRHAEEIFREFGGEETLLLADPIMGDHGRTFGMFSPEFLEGMRRLTSIAGMITPNLTEALLLADMDYTQILRAEGRSSELYGLALEAARRLRERAVTSQEVLITGIVTEEETDRQIGNLLLTDKGCFRHSDPWLEQSYSGTGDLLSACMCGLRLRGIPAEKALEITGHFLYGSIEDAACAGTPSREGVPFEGHLAGLCREAEMALQGSEA